MNSLTCWSLLATHCPATLHAREILNFIVAVVFPMPTFRARSLRKINGFESSEKSHVSMPTFGALRKKMILKVLNSLTRVGASLHACNALYHHLAWQSPNNVNVTLCVVVGGCWWDVVPNAKMQCAVPANICVYSIPRNPAKSKNSL